MLCVPVVCSFLLLGTFYYMNISQFAHLCVDEHLGDFLFGK